MYDKEKKLIFNLGGGSIFCKTLEETIENMRFINHLNPDKMEVVKEGNKFRITIEATVYIDPEFFIKYYNEEDRTLKGGN